MNTRPDTSLAHKPWLANAMFFTIAALFAYYYAWLRFAKPEWDPASLDAIRRGVAQTPFQYRVLVAWAINWIEAHLLPLPFVSTPRGVAFLIEIGATFFLLTAFRRYMRFFVAKHSVLYLCAWY